MSLHTNMNPKNDSLRVLQILITNCPDSQFSKLFVLQKIVDLLKVIEPHHLLSGRDYADYMKSKSEVRYQVGE